MSTTSTKEATAKYPPSGYTAKRGDKEWEKVVKTETPKIEFTSTKDGKCRVCQGAFVTNELHYDALSNLGVSEKQVVEDTDTATNFNKRFNANRRQQTEKWLMPTANMKATNRKTIERLTREIADVAGKAAAYGDPPITTKRALPPAVPASDIISVIRLVAGIERCAEELAEKPGEFAAFHKACKGDAAALHQAADALWGSGTAADHGRAVVLRRRAQERAELATEALRLAKGAGGAGKGAAVAHGRSGAALLAELCACKDFGGLRAL
jgi:hypothetical protein